MIPTQIIFAVKILDNLISFNTLTYFKNEFYMLSNFVCIYTQTIAKE